MEELHLSNAGKDFNIDGKFDRDGEVYVEVIDYDGNEEVYYATKDDLERMYNHIGELLGK